MVIKRIPQFKGTIIGEEDIGKDERVEYICSQCHCGPLVIIKDKIGNSDRFCRRCGITYDINDNTVRHKSKLSVPQDNETYVSVINMDYNKDVEIRHIPPVRKQELSAVVLGWNIGYYSKF